MWQDREVTLTPSRIDVTDCLHGNVADLVFRSEYSIGLNVFDQTRLAAKVIDAKRSIPPGYARLDIVVPARTHQTHTH